MGQRADCSFTVEMTIVADGQWTEGTVQHNRFAKVFTGELTGTSTVEAVTFGFATGDPAAYTGIERFEGSVGDRKGSFVLMHSGTIVGGTQTLTLTVLPGSGTGDLAGITGRADLRPDHTMTLHYELP